jgi:hypothetical protein
MFITIKSFNICQLIPTVRRCRERTRRRRSFAVIKTHRSGLRTYQHKEASRLSVNQNNLVRIKCDYVHVQPFEEVFANMLP